MQAIEFTTAKQHTVLAATFRYKFNDHVIGFALDAKNARNLEAAMFKAHLLTIGYLGEAKDIIAIDSFTLKDPPDHILYVVELS